MKARKLLLTILFLFSFCGVLYPQWTSSGTVSILGTYPSISVCSPTVAWICGGASTPMVFRTVNGGTTWTTIPTNGLAVKALMCIWAIDSLTCFVGDGGDAAGTTGGDAIVSKTTNGGLNWCRYSIRAVRQVSLTVLNFPNPCLHSVLPKATRSQEQASLIMCR